jgi:hypothetical protein
MQPPLAPWSNQLVKGVIWRPKRMARTRHRTIWREGDIKSPLGAALEAADSVFPADSASGHLVEEKEDRATLSRWGTIFDRASELL